MTNSSKTINLQTYQADCRARVPAGRWRPCATRAPAAPSACSPSPRPCSGATRGRAGTGARVPGARWTRGAPRARAADAARAPGPRSTTCASRGPRAATASAPSPWATSGARTSCGPLSRPHARASSLRLHRCSSLRSPMRRLPERRTGAAACRDSRQQTGPVPDTSEQWQRHGCRAREKSEWKKWM